MTLSVAGLCPRTAEMGCALATSSMAAGARAQFISADAGVVLSQGRSDPRLGILQCAYTRSAFTGSSSITRLVAKPWPPDGGERALSGRDNGAGVDRGDRQRQHVLARM